MITIKHCTNELEANILKEKLLEEGIESTITTESMAFGVPGNAIGQQISLAVNETDVDKAQRIIANEEKESEESMPWCPYCGSENIDKRISQHKHLPYWVWSCVVMLVCVGLIVPSPVLSIICLCGAFACAISWFIPYNSVEFICKDCGKKFKRH